ERERIPPREDPQFHLKLGKGTISDVEWTVQLLQLRHGLRSPGTMAALAELEAIGGLCPAGAAARRGGLRFPRESLADRVGVHPATVRRWESGGIGSGPQPWVRRKLAEHL